MYDKVDTLRNGMPTLTLSWDIVVIVFFAIIISSAFIIGKAQTIKIIIAAYIAIIATQGITDAVVHIVSRAGNIPYLQGIASAFVLLAGLKILLFCFLTIILSMRSGIAIAGAKEKYSPSGILLTVLLGFSLASLIASTVLLYVNGNGILHANAAISTALLPLITTSQMLLLLALNQGIWLTLPALLIIAFGFIDRE